MRKLLAILCPIIILAGAGPVRADERPLARVVLMPELVPGVVRQLVPITIEVPPAAHFADQEIRIAGLYYCGNDGRNGAWMLGAAYPADAPESASAGSNTLGAADCNADLSQVAQRLARFANQPKWVEVMRTHVRWTPWELRASVAEAAVAGGDTSAAPSLKSIGELIRFRTSDLSILQPPGQGYRFDMAVGLSGSSIIVSLFRAGRTHNPEPYLMGDWVLRAEIAEAPAIANAVADAQYGFINALLRLYAPSFQFPLQMQGATQPLVAKNIVISGGDNSMKLAGRIEFANAGYDAAVLCAGEDLAVRQVTLVPPAANCNSPDVVAQLQCQSQQAAIATTSGALAAALTGMYQGQRFHYSTAGRPLVFKLGDVQFAAHFQALKSSSRGPILSESGNAAIQRMGPASGLH